MKNVVSHKKEKGKGMNRKRRAIQKAFEPHKGYVFLLLLLFCNASLFAGNTPSSSDAGYGLWNWIINDILKGPIGQSGAAVAATVGLASAFRKDFVTGALGVALGGGLWKIDEVVTSFTLVI